MGCCYAKDTGKDFSFNRYLYPPNTQNEKYPNHNNNFNNKINDTKISETINDNINFSLTNEKIKDKIQKYISNRNKGSNDNSLNHSELWANADKSFNNLNNSVTNTSNFNLDSHRHANLPFKENNVIYGQNIRDNSKSNVSEFSHNNFFRSINQLKLKIDYEINSKNENLLDAEILRNKELFNKISNNNNNNMINIRQIKNSVDIDNEQNMNSELKSNEDGLKNKIGIKDKFFYNKDSTRLSKITEKSKDDETSYYDKSRKDLMIHTEEYKATLNSIYHNDNGLNNISSKNETLINDRNNNTSMNVSNMRGSFSSIQNINHNESQKENNHQKSTPNKIQESRERLLKLQRESIKVLNKQTSLYKKEKDEEDVDALGVNKINLNKKKEDQNLRKNEKIAVTTDETKIEINIKKHVSTVVEDLEKKFDSTNKRDNNNIQVNIKNNIYNNINIINDREDKVVVNNTNSNTNIKEKGNNVGISFRDDSNNAQIPTSNRKSRNNEQYKNELKKRIENLKTHLTTTQVYSNIPNKEEQENERIRLGLNVDDYTKYKKATDMPRQKYISPHMRSLIDKANNFMLGIVEDSDKEDKGRKLDEFIELDFKPISLNKKKKMKLNTFKIAN